MLGRLPLPLTRCSNNLAGDQPPAKLQAKLAKLQSRRRTPRHPFLGGKAPERSSSVDDLLRQQAKRASPKEHLQLHLSPAAKTKIQRFASQTNNRWSAPPNHAILFAHLLRTTALPAAPPAPPAPPPFRPSPRPIFSSSDKKNLATPSDSEEEPSPLAAAVATSHRWSPLGLM